MKKWKAFLLRLPIYLLLLGVVGFGLWQFYKQNGLPDAMEEQLQEVVPTEPSPGEQGIPPEELVDNIIHIGDTFPVYPDCSTGHLECKITSACLVTEAADCPREWVIGDGDLYIRSEEGGAYPYDEWFLPGGPLEQGGQLVRLEVEITNVDAVAAVQTEPSFDPTNPYAMFREPDLFDAMNLFFLTDLAEMDQHGNSPWFHCGLFSETGKYAQEDDMGTLGSETYALQLSPGETKQLSFVFSIDSKNGGGQRDTEYLFGLAYGEVKTDPFIYIDLNLEETA